eukprot:m.1139261 g.1139261  ORF g.1139261 m.1139261 type:complete len:196 (+) comp24441_c0_seq81:417-1004(+)
MKKSGTLIICGLEYDITDAASATGFVVLGASCYATDRHSDPVQSNSSPPPWLLAPPGLRCSTCQVYCFAQALVEGSCTRRTRLRTSAAPSPTYWQGLRRRWAAVDRCPALLRSSAALHQLCIQASAVQSKASHSKQMNHRELAHCGPPDTDGFAVLYLFRQIASLPQQAVCMMGTEGQQQYKTAFNLCTVMGQNV